MGFVYAECLDFDIGIYLSKHYSIFLMNNAFSAKYETPVSEVPITQPETEEQTPEKVSRKENVVQHINDNE